MTAIEREATTYLRRTRDPGASTGLLIALVVTALAVCGALAPAAVADRTFAPRFSTTERGQVVTAGNTVLTCPGTSTACQNAQNGTTAAADNNDFDMSYVDVDGESTTFNSSRATLALPAGSTVLFAGLYWAGDTSAGDDGQAAPAPGSRAFVSLRPPTATSYRQVTASALDTDSLSATRYQGFADVTSSVAAAGNGVYTVGNVQTGTGEGRYGGWGLVVVYRNPAESVRRLLVSTTACSRCSPACAPRPTSRSPGSSPRRPAPSSAASASSRGKATRASRATPRRSPAARSPTR